MTTPPIEDQARALLSAWAEQQAPSDAVRERTWAAVTARASAGDLGPELGPEPSLGPSVGPGLGPGLGLGGSARVRLALLGLGVTATIAAIVVSLGGPREAAEPASIGEPRAVALPEPASPPPTAPAPAPTTSSAGPATEPTLEGTTPTDEPAPATERPAQRRRSQGSGPANGTASATAQPNSEPSSEPSSDAQEGDLAAELALLGRARASLKAGDPGAALAALDEHARAFPRGALRSERELTRITAACAAGDLDHAEQVARRFIRAHPSSTEAKRLADTCIGDRL